MKKSLQGFILWSSLPLLAACASPGMPPAESSSSAPAEQRADESASRQLALEPLPVPENKPVVYGNFSRAQLTTAILSELGGQRGHLPKAAEDYYRLALETRDLGIIRRALEFAAASDNDHAVLELAQLWELLDPEAVDPHLILGYHLLEQENYLTALKHMGRALQLGGSVDFTSVSARTYALSAERRHRVRTSLESLRQQHPQETSLHYALIQLLDQDGESEQAHIELARARELFGENARILLLEAQLLQNLGRSEESATVLASAVEQYPGNRLLRFTYAQMLVQANELQAAYHQFSALRQQEPHDYEILYSMALLNLELNSLNEAQQQLERLIQVNYRRNEAVFYLGYLMELQNQPLAALSYYQQVDTRSAAFLSAQRQILRLLVAEGRFDEAEQWRTQFTAGNEALEPVFAALEVEALLAGNYTERAGGLLDRVLQRHPDDVDLLYARTLVNEQRITEQGLSDTSSSKLAQIETDLRRIITLNPNDARALNHLGYSLADRTDRYYEALQLIERAIALDPNNPAIIDSLGWVQYKLGRHDEALQNLQRAYAAYPDHEVAAHLGEVLWVTGNEEEALQVWQDALEQQPDSELLRNALERFAP